MGYRLGYPVLPDLYMEGQADVMCSGFALCLQTSMLGKFAIFLHSELTRSVHYPGKDTHPSKISLSAKVILRNALGKVASREVWSSPITPVLRRLAQEATLAVY